MLESTSVAGYLSNLQVACTLLQPRQASALTTVHLLTYQVYLPTSYLTSLTNYLPTCVLRSLPICFQFKGFITIIFDYKYVPRRKQLRQKRPRLLTCISSCLRAQLQAATFYGPTSHSDKMQSLRSLRPIVSRLQPSTLPRVTRSFSASTKLNYEFIQVSEPKPGVGQGETSRWGCLFTHMLSRQPQ